MTRRVLYILLFSPFFLFAQTRKIDSLRRELGGPTADSSRLRTLNLLGAQLRRAGRCDTAVFLLEQSRELALKLSHKAGLAAAHTGLAECAFDEGKYEEAIRQFFAALKLYAEVEDIENVSYITDKVASVYDRQGNYHASLKLHFISLRLSRALGDLEGVATSYNNIGAVYHSLANYPEALRYEFLALRSREASMDTLGIARAQVNLGNSYFGQKNYEEALKYYFRALKTLKQLDHTYGISLCYNNIGTVYTDQGKYPEALENLFAGLKLRDHATDKGGLADSYNNIGLAYANMHNDSAALRYYFMALEINEQLGDKEGKTLLSNNIGLLYMDQGKPALSRSFLKKALALSQEIRTWEHSMAAHQHLAGLDSAAGDYASALRHYKLFIVYRDSINNEENTKKTVQAQMQYEFDKKEAATRLEQEKKEAVTVAEARRQRIILFAISGFGLLVLAFAVFAYRSFLQKRKVNVEMTRQKELIEEKQKEILDSIHYARRIQTSLMPNEKLVRSILSRMKKEI